MAYKKNISKTTLLKRNTSYIGETIEQKIMRIVNNKEPIRDGAPLIYTDRADGVLPEYDIKTDRFEVAIDAMDKISKSEKARREERHMSDEQKAEKKRKADLETASKNKQADGEKNLLDTYGKPESIQGT